MKQLIFLTLLTGLLSTTGRAALVHPGCLSTAEDLDRMTAKVTANEQPWKDSWEILIANSHASLNYSPNPKAIVYVGGGYSENYMSLANDAAAAYQCALRYYGSGNTDYADKAVEILNDWATVNTNWIGDTNVGLRKGIYGYQLACTAELLRDYDGWSAADFAAFQQYLLDMYYPSNADFLTRHNDTVDGHYWANWDLANMASMLAIGVVCDRQDIFDEAIDYFYHGAGNGSINHAVHYVHPNGLGQWQESGRDQGHSLLGPQLMSVFCEIAWNQGIDLYHYENSRFLASVEYVSKYNLWEEVPYATYVWRHAHTYDYQEDIQSVIGESGRGAERPGWALIYNHYVNRLGQAAPYTQAYAEQVGPEGGGGNYGTTSGGFDSLGFTTLTHSREPIASGATPKNLLPVIAGDQLTLSWQGSSDATSYNIKRSRFSGGAYSTVATVSSNNLFYVDSGLTRGATYYYVISANTRNGESSNSEEVSVTADGHLSGTLIGTDGSWGDAGADKSCVFDGSLDNYFDPPASGAWVGLDLGDGNEVAIEQVKYCPRLNYPSRMVGGKFQGSNTADFSSGVVDLFTISSEPAEEEFTIQNISNTNTFRYVRYKPASGVWCNVAEIEFVGAFPTPSPAVSTDEYKISKHAMIGGTNLTLIVSNTVPGHFTQVLYTESLLDPDWQPAGLSQEGTGSNLYFNLDLAGIESTRFFKLNVQ